MNSERDIQQFKQTVLDEFQRLGEGDSFTFECHSKIKCFNLCCADVSIALSPYDILRMKKALELESEEFLRRYTFVPFSAEQRLPVVILRMRPDEKKTCPFVTEQGCSIYENRPWACRMYPLGMASPKDADLQGKPFYFLMDVGAEPALPEKGAESCAIAMKEKLCEGFREAHSQTIKEWLEDQGIVEYNRWGEFFKEISLHDFFLQGGSLDPSKMEMLYMACYDIDRFRRFVFESSFLKSFDVSPEELESIREDNAMMLFAFRWLKYSLFGEPSMKIREKVRQEWEKKLPHA